MGAGCWMPKCARLEHIIHSVPQVRKRKWDNYTSGEELFGLPVTPYPELEATAKEVGNCMHANKYTARQLQQTAAPDAL